MTHDAVALDREARRRAVLPTGSFIVQAPAGSGKTTLLTLRFLRLLAEVERPEQIVAITFTRKAAAEMRHRIVSALAAAEMPLPDDVDERARELHHHACAALARSRELGWGLEHNPARLHVQTIDGLSHWLARRLPLAARIGTSAALVDDARTLYAEAARRTVARLDEGGPVAVGLLRLARAVNHEPRQLATLISGMLGERELWLPKLLQTGSGPALRAGVDRLLRQALESELAAVADAIHDIDWLPVLALCRRAAEAGAPESPARVLAAYGALPVPSAASAGAWRALADLLLRSDKALLLKQVGEKQGFLTPGDASAWGPLKRSMKEELATLAGHEGLAETLGRLRRLPPTALSDAQWERIDALSVVLPHAVAELMTHFAERDSLDHPAVAAAARDALDDEAAPTELALALDYRIHHLLVDEYQDTSPSQARLLDLLVAGWQPGDGRSLFCVGDPMQSIYAFREADVTLFLQAQQQGIGGVALVAERLGRNFRSSPPIVEWVNASFSALLPAANDFERGAVRYSPAAAAKPGEPGDGVRVHPLIDADERAMASEVAATVREALALPEQPSIAILVRGRPSLPPILAALRDAGIEYRGVELESLLDRPAMRDLVALLRALLHDGDRTAWLAVLRTPWCGLPLADLLAIAGGDGDTSIRARLGDAEGLSPDAAARARRAGNLLDAALAMRGAMSLGSWLKSAWLALGGPATVGDLSDLANAELLFGALDHLEREAGCRPQLSEIETAVQRIMASPVGSDEARVQVMTIHRAKGLEFDVVILPDLQRGARREDRPLLYWTTIATGPGERGIVLAGRADSGDGEEGGDALERWMRELGKERERLELGRVAYVAATRARRRLHLIGSVRSQPKDEGRVLKAPPAGSLLGFLWPVAASHFREALAARPAGERAPTGGRRRLAAPPAQRLAADFKAPEPAPSLRVAGLRIAGTDSSPIRRSSTGQVRSRRPSGRSCTRNCSAGRTPARRAREASGRKRGGSGFSPRSASTKRINRQLSIASGAQCRRSPEARARRSSSTRPPAMRARSLRSPR